ncbi:DivIVA domain-containing protein [Pseudochryseolinea flava]|uniref:Cell division protein DivIVA n=1 Tax=Pseudochryseolinea flava TaxID=2059302 RepID=A0A364Y0Z0_9BACT|nr:DivIVA domain-containing protein [Pseudochryseolinea flava]RAV99418.1 cell division protein DivIVA [Pseudochryseolinea flava]
MRVTPLEIRQKTFERNFRGYQTEEVHAFLQTLSQEWERMSDDNKELRIKLEATEREVTKLREVETSLYKTLKTAEDTGASVIEQARTAAELHLKESQLKAEAMLNEAKSKAKDTIEESDERARQIVDEMEDRLRILVESYKKLESSREDLLADLKRMANETMERVERAKNMSKDFNPDQHLAMAKREAKKLAFPNIDFDRKLKPEPVPVVEKEIVLQHVTLPPVDVPQPRKVQKSFFDEIG